MLRSGSQTQAWVLDVVKACGRIGEIAAPCAWFAGEAGDRIFHKTGSKQQQGSTGLLTRGMVDRDMFYGHAMILAMVPFINPDLY